MALKWPVMPRSRVKTSRGVFRSTLFVCGVFAALLTVACGGSSSSGSSSSPPSTTPPTATPPSTEGVAVNGTERLGWTQPADSVATIRGFSFFAYVDNSRSPLSDVRCSSNARPGGYECSAALPKMSGGRHVIELATVAGSGGMESARSAQLVVNMVGSGTASSTTDEAPAQAASTMTVASCGDSSWQCTPVPNPVSGLGPITALEPLPDGRVLAVESGTRLLVQQGNSWLVGYDVTSDPRTPTHIAAVAPDRAFDSTHFVYVAEVVDDADGTRTTRVIRTREVASRLGEPSTIVADESLVRQGDPALSVGSDGFIYLAMPGDPAAADQTLRQGRLLRFTPDGSAAGTAGPGSATLAEIAVNPTSLAWDPQERLWIAAAREPATTAVARLDAVPAARWTRQSMALSLTMRDESAGVQSLAFGATPSSAAGVPVYLVADSPATLYRGVIGSGAGRTTVSALTSVPLGGWEPTAVAFRADGGLVVAARQDTGAGEIRRLFNLTLSRIIPIPD